MENKLGNIFKKLSNDWEKNYYQLKENIIYGQRISKTGSWTYNIQTGEVFWTEEIYNLIGCNSQGLNKNLESFLPYVHPNDLDTVKHTTINVTAKDYDIEFCIVTPNEQLKYVHEKTTILYDEENRPFKVVGIIQDITEQKFSEYNLELLGEHLNQAQKVAGVGSWKYNVIKDEFYGSDEMFRIYDVEPSEFNNDFNNAIRLIHPEDQFKVQDAMKKHLLGQTCTLDFRIPQKDGTNKIVTSKAEPVFDSKGEVVGIIGTMQDVTEMKILEQQLKKNYQIISQAEALNHVGSWEMDIVNNKNRWSNEAYKILGIEAKDYDITFNKFIQYVHPDDINKIDYLLENPPKEPLDFEFRIIRPNGEVRNILERINFTFNENGQPIYSYGIIQDITEKKELQRELEQKQKDINDTQERFKALIQHSYEVFEIINSDGKIIYISDSVERIIGYKPEERIGKKVYDFYNDKESIKISKMIETVMNEPHKIVREDIIFTDKTGKEKILDVFMKNLLNEPYIQGIIINFREITDRVLMERHMAYITTHDEITRLPNNVYFKKKLRLQCEYANETNTKFALIRLDINGLKNIKISFGYEFSDKLIKNIVHKLRNYLGDYFLSRCTEEQFGIIINGIEKIEECEKEIVGLLDIFNQPFIVDKYEIDISINIGACIYPNDANDFETIRKNSNIALRRAIKEGKNIYKFFSTDLDIQYYKEFTLSNDLHSAIDKEQIKVYFQPIVNLKTNEIIATEALLRWEHPTWGLLTPNEFITIAEETGEIVDIGKFIIREVCRNYKKWNKNIKTKTKISVNFSVKQFLESDLVDSIYETIKEFKLNPNFLIIEITESILIEEADKVMSDIKRLRSYGIQIALDDFGTGYSSLAYLSSFNIDIIKLDGSFVKNIITDKRCNVITTFIVRMAQELKIKLVVEGIESWEQLTYLRGLNCFAGQGYIYSKPVENEDFEKLLLKGRCNPININHETGKLIKDRRKYFRISFHQHLEAEMTMLNISGRDVNVGNTKVLVNNIGPGGLSYISDIKLPIEKDISLLFVTQLLNEDIKIYGKLIWTNEIGQNLYEYGVEFILDENERVDIVRVLNLVQIKMRKDILFAEGNFVPSSPYVYFYNDIK